MNHHRMTVRYSDQRIALPPLSYIHVVVMFAASCGVLQTLSFLRFTSFSVYIYIHKYPSPSCPTSVAAIVVCRLFIGLYIYERVCVDCRTGCCTQCVLCNGAQLLIVCCMTAFRLDLTKISNVHCV